MSSRGPPRKRRKTAKAAESATQATTIHPASRQDATTTVTTNSAPGQSLKDLVAEIIPAIIPAITQGVVSALQDIGVINSQPQQDVQNSQNTTSQISDPVIQGTCTTNTIFDNSTSSAVVPVPDQSSSDSTEHVKNKAVSMARPLDLGIDSKIKGKIWANQFIDLYTLLPSKRKERLELVDNGDGVIRCKKSTSGSITSIDHWLEAFHVFVAIYTAKYPTEAPSLMRHMNIVHKLAKQAGDEAALFYDEQFRLWREDQPELLPWGMINSELQNEALAMGISKTFKQNPAGQRKPKTGIKKYCFRFNNQNGQCPKGKDCSFPHICQKCGGPHSRKQCPKPTTGYSTGNNLPSNNHSSKRASPSTPATKS